MQLLTSLQDRKNALEEFIYDQRSKLDDRHKAYVQANEKEAFLKELSAAEEWLYSEEGEDATKSTYVQRLDALQKLGNPIIERYQENDARPRAASQLREALNTYMSAATSGDEKYSHLTDEDKQKVIEKCANVDKWLNDNLAKQAEMPKNVKPKITSAEILKNKEEVQYVCGPM
jgi:heat shock 70kDa protein 4